MGKALIFFTISVISTTQSLVESRAKIEKRLEVRGSESPSEVDLTAESQMR